jgi:SET domain-containing protein
MDLHERWPHRWRNKKTDAFHSPIHGVGVIANEQIAQGEVVMVYGGIIVPRNEIQQYRSVCGHVGIQLSDDFFMVPPSHEELEAQGVINHSCKPNVGFRSQVEVVAMHDIKKGEEVFLDYACLETDFEPFDCKCGSEMCRKKVTQDDWRLPELQQRYGKYFSPYIRIKVWPNYSGA